MDYFFLKGGAGGVNPLAKEKKQKPTKPNLTERNVKNFPLQYY